ncbi:MAG: hypothetical protein M5U09_00225 [Gammaproteobacteria bacterium]|nr:hypothetical protein [Gammaproteobacteria bacterium]
MLKRFDELGRDSLESIDHRRAREAVLRCAACSEVISRRPRPIERRGAHRHHFVNPHGFSFHVGCFGRAERTTGSGRSTTEHTWFPRLRLEHRSVCRLRRSRRVALRRTPRQLLRADSLPRDRDAGRGPLTTAPP